MANWNNNDGFKNQRKRTFIYKSAGQNKTAGNAIKVDQNLTTIASSSFSSPRKKIKSSYSYYDKTRSDREAAEELCSDLPVDAFEDDLGVDFGDDLTAEELCEAACVAEQEIAVKDEDNMNENISFTSAGEEEDYLNALDQDILEEATRKHLNSTVCPPATTITTGPSGAITDETTYETSAHETTALLFSSPGCSTNRNTDAMMQRNLNGSSKTHVSNGCSARNTGLYEDFTYIKSKLLESEEKIKKLEEDKFLMDGELKTLRDTLEHTQVVDAKQRERIRMIEEENRKTVDVKEKELKKQIEHLTTQLCFKDQEIAQAKEQVKKQMQASNENIHLSPQRKKFPKLADSSVIPTGQSFFEKKPSDIMSSPKNKVVKSPVKSKPEVVKHVLGSSSTGNFSSDSREFEIGFVKREKDILDGSGNELLQKLLKLENIGVKSMSPEFEVCSVNQNILSLLNSSSRVGQMEQSRREDGVDVQKLVKQQTYTPKKGIQLDLNAESKDSGLRQSVYDNIQELLTAQLSNFNDKQEACLDLVSNCKATNFLDSHQKSSSVQGFLPLLEYHISQYIDLRLESDEESLSSTCSPGSPGEGGEMRQPADKDGSVSLFEALDAAVQSLKCLNILILHSDDVCEMLLRSSKVFSSSENEVEELVGTSSGIQQPSNSNDDKSDLLNLVFKLTVPLQNEPLLVTQVALNVISSLAQRCPSEYRTRYLPLLCDRLLPQCISRDSSVTMISLVVPILMVTASIPSLIKHLCSQSDECLLLKVYQGCLRDTDDLPYHTIFKVIDLIETILSSRNDAIPLLLDSECHCSLELIKYLVLLLHKRMVFLRHFPPDTLKLNQNTRDSFILLRRGVFLLVNLLTNSSRLLGDLHVEVEQQYVNLIIGATQLYGAIKDIPEVEGLLLQDLLDFEHIEDDEVQQDYDDDGTEEMDVDTS